MNAFSKRFNQPMHICLSYFLYVLAVGCQGKFIAAKPLDEHESQIINLTLSVITFDKNDAYASNFQDEMKDPILRPLRYGFSDLYPLRFFTTHITYKEFSKAIKNKNDTSLAIEGSLYASKEMGYLEPRLIDLMSKCFSNSSLIYFCNKGKFSDLPKKVISLYFKIQKKNIDMYRLREISPITIESLVFDDYIISDEFNNNSNFNEEYDFFYRKLSNLRSIQPSILGYNLLLSDSAKNRYFEYISNKLSHPLANSELFANLSTSIYNYPIKIASLLYLYEGRYDIWSPIIISEPFLSSALSIMDLCLSGQISICYSYLKNFRKSRVINTNKIKRFIFAKYVNSQTTFTKRDLYKHLHINVDELTPIINKLVKEGILNKLDVPQKENKKGRPPSPVYLVNSEHDEFKTYCFIEGARAASK